MSENKNTVAEVTNVINTRELIDKERQINDLKARLLELEVDKKTFSNLLEERKREEVSSKTPPVVRIIKEIRSNKKHNSYYDNPWNDHSYTETPGIEISSKDVSFNTALDEVKTNLKKEYESEIENLYNENKSLKENVENKTRDIKKLKDSERDLYEEKLKKIVKLKDSAINELSENLKKERNNKSDRELEKKRNEEIATLREHIDVLKDQLDKLTTGNWFKRMRNRIRVKAINELSHTYAKLKAEAERIIDKWKASYRNRWDNYYPW